MPKPAKLKPIYTFSDGELAQELGRVAIEAFRQIPGLSDFETRQQVGVAILSRMCDTEPVKQNPRLPEPRGTIAAFARRMEAQLAAKERILRPALLGTGELAHRVQKCSHRASEFVLARDVVKLIPKSERTILGLGVLIADMWAEAAAYAALLADRALRG